MRAVGVSRKRVTSQNSESSPGYHRISSEGTADVVMHGLYSLACISPRTDLPTDQPESEVSFPGVSPATQREPFMIS